MSESTALKSGLPADQAPIVIIIFKRPDCVRELISKLRILRPPRIYVIADGARPDRPEERAACEAARAEIKRIDWECDVERIYEDMNLGCANRVSSGITEVLRREERIIILEEDCIPDPSFFKYCNELLQMYRSDERVMAVTGQSPFCAGTSPSSAEPSYFFSRYALCWGWATWRRAWKHYDHEMGAWPRLGADGAAQLRAILEGNVPLTRYWAKRFERVYRGEVDSWAYRWTLSCWARGGLVAVPRRNLVQNVGFDNELSTHTRRQHRYLSLPAGTMPFPLRHPDLVVRDAAGDRAIEYRNFHYRLSDKLRAVFLQSLSFLSGSHKLIK